MHIVVLGAGVVGLFVARDAVRRGWRVTVVERDGAERDGCSYGNAGMLVPSHITPLAAPGVVLQGLKWMWNPESPFSIRLRPSWELLSWGLRFWRSSTARHVERCGPVLRDLQLASRARYEELSREQGDPFSLTQRGLLVLCQSNQTLTEEAHAAERAHRLGLPAEVLDPAGLARVDPDVEMRAAGGVLYPLDCHLTPGLLMRTLQRQLEQAGVEFRWHTNVTRAELRGRSLRALVTGGGETIAGDEFVLAAGSWSSEWSRQVGLRLPLQGGKGYSLTLAAPRQRPRLCSILAEARVAVTPMGTALRCGGTLEIRGLNDPVNPRRVRGIIKAMPQYFPQFREDDFTGVPVWQGLRPCTPDGMPYIGRSRSIENLIVATGHAMMGVSLAPVTGEIVSHLAAREPVPHDLTLLSPDRFG